VMIDNVQGSREATNHLIQLGHRRIAYLGDRLGHQSDTERFSGYREALDKAALPFCPELVAHGDGKSEEAMVATESLLSLADRPTAIFCYNDMTALGVLRVLHARKLKVPADISLVGFDDLLIASYTDPPLTTVRQPRRRMGILAMESLLQLMRGENPSQAINVAAELVVRESSGPPAKVRK
jgi:DNA-binding LacI/PurR family transcriptional regulator